MSQLKIYQEDRQHLILHSLLCRTRHEEDKADIQRLGSVIALPLAAVSTTHRKYAKGGFGVDVSRAAPVLLIHPARDDPQLAHERRRKLGIRRRIFVLAMSARSLGRFQLREVLPDLCPFRAIEPSPVPVHVRLRAGRGANGTEHPFGGILA